MPDAKLTQTQRQEIADRFVAGDTQMSLAGEYGVSKQTIIRVCRKLKAVRVAPKPATIQDLVEFTKRAKSILWALDPGPEEGRKNYNSWKARILELADKNGGGLSKNEAIVYASKECPSLSTLFGLYNVEKYDPSPESHAHIKHFGDTGFKKGDVTCEGIDQTYRESLRWAIEAAGKFSRTRERPTSCPCDKAWYLYEQAVSDPKDFLSRVGQVESKGDAESEARDKAAKSGTRSIAEIDGMLSELDKHEEESEDA
jgi:hypothetical protein